MGRGLHSKRGGRRASDSTASDRSSSNDGVASGHSVESPGAAPHKHRWRRRALLGAGVLVSLVIFAAGGAVVYAKWRFDQIPKVSLKHLATRLASKPFNVLLVGSDSRQFVDDTQKSKEFGASGSGQRSDVIIVARIVPALHQVKILSIPRDTWVEIPGNGLIQGPNKINAAFDSGPQLLIDTIANSFSIPVSNFIEVGFPGLVNMVDAAGGVYLNFSVPVRDFNSHLGITRTGCHLVLGSQALALVRSRDLEYEKDGYWHGDVHGDLSRIQRQDAFFRALIPRLSSIIGSPLGVNSFLGAAVKNLTFDRSLSMGELLSLGRTFHGMTSADLTMETLPTIPWVTPGGADVQVPAQKHDEKMIGAFLNFSGSSTASDISAEVTGAPGATGSTGRSPTSRFGGATIGSRLRTEPTVTTLPSGAIGSQVQRNTQAEPWNPTTCAR